MIKSLAVFFGACTLIAASSAPQINGSWPTPSKTVSSGGSFWNDSYKKSFSRQHLGSDLTAVTTDRVLSPADGFVIFNNSQGKKVTQGTAYLVIKDAKSGWEHVIGHVNSTRPACSLTSFAKKTCSEATRVYKGQSEIGYPMPKNEFGVHVHWGVNTKSVSSAMGFFSGQEWGWGRAPAAAELKKACSLGWVDPMNLVKCV